LVIPIFIWAAILVFDYQRIGKLDDEDLRMNLFVRAGLLLALISAAWMSSRPFRVFAVSAASRWIVACIAMAVLVGILRGNSFALIVSDLKIIAWLYGGYALASLLLASGKVRPMLIIFAAGVYALLIASAREAQVLDDTGRIGHGVYWDYSELSFIFVGLFYNYLIPFNRMRLVLLGIAALIHSYYVVNLGANRSDLLSFGIFGLCAFAALISRPRAAGLRRFRFPRIKIALLILALSAGLLAIPGIGDSIFSARTLARLQDIGVYSDTSQTRVEELAGFFRQSSLGQLLLGRGLGGTIRNVTGQQEIAFLHIAVFEFLMKLGLIPFLAIVVLLYFKVPVDFVRTLWGSRSIDRARAGAILAAYPFLIGWLSLTMMSWGIDWYYALGLGMLWAGFGARVRAASRPYKTGEPASRIPVLAKDPGGLAEPAIR
jgi:hypothetical protein